MKRFKSLAIIALIIVMVVAFGAFGLDRFQYRLMDREGARFGMPGSFSDESPRVITQDMPAYDFPIDPNTYVLGPGDIMGIDVMGETFQNYTLEINPQGGIAFPEIGFVKAADHTITDLNQQLNQVLAGKLKFDSLGVYLVAAKKVRITITGAAANPGVHILNSPSRLIDALNVAGKSPWARLDSVIIKWQDEINTVDFYNFFSTGNPENNPVVPSGAVVILPSCLESGRYISLKTHTANTQVAIFDETKLSDLPLIFPTGFEGVKQIRIIINRGSSLQSFEGYAPIKLEHGDTITVQPAVLQVYVAGMVANPGDFPYFPSMNVQQYIARAGGVTFIGSPSKTVLYRDGKKFRAKKYDFLRPGDIIEVKARAMAKLSEYLSVASILASLIIAAVATGIWN